MEVVVVALGLQLLEVLVLAVLAHKVSSSLSIRRAVRQ
jgi:hypothetical protein